MLDGCETPTPSGVRGVRFCRPCSSMAPDVADPFSVFSELTFELAKLNLSGLARKGLGRRMGAVTP